MPAATAIKECPHDEATLQAHKGVNEGLFHCNTCGCCFQEDGELREGTSACSGQAAHDAQLESTQLLKKITDLQAEVDAKPKSATAAEVEAAIAEVNEKHEEELALIKDQQKKDAEAHEEELKKIAEANDKEIAELKAEHATALAAAKAANPTAPAQTTPPPAQGGGAAKS